MQNNLTIQCEDIVRKTVMLCWIFANFPMLAKLTLPELPQNGVKLVGNSCSFATVCYHFCVAFRKYDGWGVRRGEGILPICCWPKSHLLLLPFGRYQCPASYYPHPPSTTHPPTTQPPSAPPLWPLSVASFLPSSCLTTALSHAKNRT